MKQTPLNIGIIGAGKLSRALASAFQTPTNTIVKINNPGVNLNSLTGTQYVFVCAPTCGRDGKLSNVNVDAVLNQLSLIDYSGVVIIKSTLTLDGFQEMLDRYPKLMVVINPDFARESWVDRDILDPSQIVVGYPKGYDDVYESVQLLYSQSYVRRRWMLPMTQAEAVLYKLMADTFLSTKVTLMNEFRELLFTVSDRPWNDFAHGLAQDPRIGHSHTMSPGPDGSVGYGGRLFSCSAPALAKYAASQDVAAATICAGIDGNPRKKSIPLLGDA